MALGANIVVQLIAVYSLYRCSWCRFSVLGQYCIQLHYLWLSLRQCTQYPIQTI